MGINRSCFFKAVVLAPLAGLVLLTACRPQASRGPEAGQTSRANGSSAAANPADAKVNGSRGVDQAHGSLDLLVPAGTRLRVRVNEALNTKRNRAGDRFSAVLESPVVDREKVVLPAETLFHGHVVNSHSSGRLKGRAVLSLALDEFEVNGAHYTIDTSSNARASGGHKKRNWALVGGGTGLGAALGAIAGGGTGALIGAGAGAATGTAGAMITGKKNVALQPETLMTFILRKAVTIQGQGARATQ